MSKKLLAFLIAQTVLWTAFFMWRAPSNEVSVPIHTDPIPVQYVGSVKLPSISVRLLVLKHCFEQMADDDARLAIQAANLAASKGLDIKEIGNYTVTRNGKARLVWGEKYPLDKIKEFVSEQMKVNAVTGDTLVIMTIGHGGTQGQLAELGNRKEVMQAFAEAAAENEQETVWWQLSCYAAASLPSISSLSPEQQGLFTVITSSDAHTPSPAGVEGKVMERFFVALASDDSSVDTNNDDVITAGEMSQFLATGRTRTVYAKSNEEVVFGLNLAWRIPIVDRQGHQREFPRNYIPLPQKDR